MARSWSTGWVIEAASADEAVIVLNDSSSTVDIVFSDVLMPGSMDGFGLARPSNTTPVIVLRFEADDDAALRRIQEDFRRAILQVKPDAVLPF